MSQKSSLFSALNALCADIGNEKAASVKSAAPEPADPGGYDGPSSHPSADVDNGGHTTTEGARSAENERDVKEDQGRPGVDASKNDAPGSQDDVQPNIGTTQSAVGEDPSTEDNYKGGKDDPGSAHPARTDNDSLDGEKYASYSAERLRETFVARSHDVLAAIAVRGPEAFQQKAAAAAPQSATVADGLRAAITKVASAASDADTEPANADLQAGYELAALCGLTKEAAQENVAGILADTIQDGYLDADLTGAYLHAYARKKQAEEAGEIDENGGGTDDPPAEEGLLPPVDGGDAGLPPALGGGGGGAGDLLSGGEAPASGPAADPLAGVSSDEAIAQLAAALDELGIPVEELAAAMDGGDGGGLPADAGAGLPPEAGAGLPPEAAAPPVSDGMKLASAVRNFKRSGRYAFTATKTARERALRNHMKSYVTELLR